MVVVPVSTNSSNHNKKCMNSYNRDANNDSHQQ